MDTSRWPGISAGELEDKGYRVYPAWDTGLAAEVLPTVLKRRPFTGVLDTPGLLRVQTALFKLRRSIDSGEQNG